MTLPPTWSLFGDEHLPHRLLLLSKMIDRATARQLRNELDLSIAEWRVLAFVCSIGPSNAASICAAFDVDRGEVSRAVKRLLGIGLITRSPSSSHAKRLDIEASPTGKSLFARGQAARQGYFQKILEGISASEREQFDAVLTKLAIGVSGG